MINIKNKIVKKGFLFFFLLLSVIVSCSKKEKSDNKSNCNQRVSPFTTRASRILFFLAQPTVQNANLLPYKQGLYMVHNRCSDIHDHEAGYRKDCGDARSAIRLSMSNE